MSSFEVIAHVESGAIYLGMNPIRLPIPNRADVEMSFHIYGAESGYKVLDKRFLKDGVLFVDYAAICQFEDTGFTVKAYIKEKQSVKITLDEALAMCLLMHVNPKYKVIDAYKHMKSDGCRNFVSIWATDARNKIDEEN